MAKFLLNNILLELNSGAVEFNSKFLLSNNNRSWVAKADGQPLKLFSVNVIISLLDKYTSTIAQFLNIYLIIRFLHKLDYYQKSTFLCQICDSFVTIVWQFCDTFFIVLY